MKGEHPHNYIRYSPISGVVVAVAVGVGVGIAVGAEFVVAVRGEFVVAFGVGAGFLVVIGVGVGVEFAFVIGVGVAVAVGFPVEVVAVLVSPIVCESARACALALAATSASQILVRSHGLRHYTHTQIAREGRGD